MDPLSEQDQRLLAREAVIRRQPALCKILLVLYVFGATGMIAFTERTADASESRVLALAGMFSFWFILGELRIARNKLRHIESIRRYTGRG